MNILSLHSQVIAGHVGNGAAVLPLQMLGFEVWAIPTVVYSNHPGHGSFTGRVTPADEITSLVNGMDQRRLFDRCDGILAGYMGDSAQIDAVTEIIQRVRARNPDVVVCCDPILGDRDSGLYVSTSVQEAVTNQLIPVANIVTPNHFELETLIGNNTHTLDEALAATRSLQDKGPDVVMCTSLEREGATPNQIETLLAGPDGVWLGRHDKVANAPHGTGDMLAALLLGHHLLGKPPEVAFREVLSSVWSVIRASADLPDLELAVVSARAQITAPEHSVEIEKVA